MIEPAFAKINLTLQMRRRRSDGYHDIETLFAFVDSGDVISAEPAEELRLRMTGPFAQGLSETDNLVLDAARALNDYAGKQGQGAAITLDKRLPVASGIGGGSADAAAALRLLNRLWGLGFSLDVLAKIGAPLGADIPACVYSSPLRGAGTGTDLIPAEGASIAGKNLLLVNPRVALSTPDIFAQWDGIDNGPMAQGDSLQLALSGCNGLQAAAIQLCPPIQDILELLNGAGCLLARMSGSGATCFGVYSDVDGRDNALRQIQRAFPAYWTLSGEIK